MKNESSRDTNFGPLVMDMWIFTYLLYRVTKNNNNGTHVHSINRNPKLLNQINQKFLRMISGICQMLTEKNDYTSVKKNIFYSVFEKKWIFRITPFDREITNLHQQKVTPVIKNPIKQSCFSPMYVKIYMRIVLRLCNMLSEFQWVWLKFNGFIIVNVSTWYFVC